MDSIYTNSERVSVVMPSYNSGLYLPSAIESVLSQTYKNFELIIVDDFSSDNSVDIVNKYIALDERVQLIKLSVNKGAGEARNKALDVSKGEYIAFLDADDVWLPSKLEQQITFMNENHAAISFTSYSLINLDGADIRGGVIAKNRLNLNSYMRTTGIGLSTAIINKAICGDIHFSSMRLRQDTFLWLTLLSQGYSALGLNKCLVKYRIRKEQISGNKLNAIVKTFQLYWNVNSIPKSKIIINYLFYISNAVLKRLKRSNRKYS